MSDSSAVRRMKAWFLDHGKVRFKKGQTCFSCGHDLPCKIDCATKEELTKCWYPRGTIGVRDEKLEVQDVC